MTCSAGTYIRSLAVDIGRRLDTVAHLQGLRRISSGIFNVDDAIVLKDSDSIDKKGLLERVIPLPRALPEMVTANIDTHLAMRIRNGYRPLWNELDMNGELSGLVDGNIKLMAGSDLVAVIETESSVVNKNRWLKKIKVFN